MGSSAALLTPTSHAAGRAQLARFDFTWGTPEYHQETLDNLRKAMELTETACAVVLETMGREILVMNRYLVQATLGGQPSERHWAMPCIALHACAVGKCAPGMRGCMSAAVSAHQTCPSMQPCP